MVNFNLEIPDELHKQFKMRCVQKEITMQQKVLNLIENYVEEEK